VGGSIWHTIGGARNAPSGQRIAQAISRAKARVPIVGGMNEIEISVQLSFFEFIFSLVIGSFAVWGVLFSACDCTLVYMRKKV
jgi:mitochondrial import inner membrane translocase subunit TIM17